MFCSRIVMDDQQDDFLQSYIDVARMYAPLKSIFLHAVKEKGVFYARVYFFQTFQTELEIAWILIGFNEKANPNIDQSLGPPMYFTPNSMTIRHFGNNKSISTGLVIKCIYTLNPIQFMMNDNETKRERYTYANHYMRTINETWCHFKRFGIHFIQDHTLHTSEKCCSEEDELFLVSYKDKRWKDGYACPFCGAYVNIEMKPNFNQQTMEIWRLWELYDEFDNYLIWIPEEVLQVIIEDLY